MIDGLLHGAGVNFLAIEENLAANVLSVSSTKNTHREFGSTRPHQSGSTYNFTAIDVQIHALDDLAFRMHSVLHGPVFYFKYAFTHIGCALRVAVGHIA